MLVRWRIIAFIVHGMKRWRTRSRMQKKTRRTIKVCGLCPARAVGIAANGRIHSSGCLDVRGLLALRTLGDFKRHFLAFFKCLEAIHLDRGEVREKIFAAIVRSDEPVAFRVIEPFHSTSCHSACLDRKADGLRDLFEFQGSLGQSGLAIKPEPQHPTAF